MGFKYLKKTAVSITLLFAMVLNLTAIQPVNVFANEVQKKTETAVPVCQASSPYLPDFYHSPEI